MKIWLFTFFKQNHSCRETKNSKSRLKGVRVSLKPRSLNFVQGLWLRNPCLNKVRQFIHFNIFAHSCECINERALKYCFTHFLYWFFNPDPCTNFTALGLRNTLTPFNIDLLFLVSRHEWFCLKNAKSDILTTLLKCHNL